MTTDDDSPYEHPPVYHTPDGRQYIKVNELARSAAFKRELAKILAVKVVIHADKR